jgi:hypothetical protein
VYCRLGGKCLFTPGLVGSVLQAWWEGLCTVGLVGSVCVLQAWWEVFVYCRLGGKCFVGLAGNFCVLQAWWEVFEYCRLGGKCLCHIDLVGSVCVL